MKRKCNNIEISDIEFIKSSISHCLMNKNKNRNDIQRIFKEYKTIDNLALAMSNEIKNRKLEIKPIWYKEKFDNSSQKLRRIGIQDIKQQMYDYIAVDALVPVLTRIGKHQYASIKGRGPIKGVEQIYKWVQNPKVKYASKLDIKKCYESVDRRKLMKFLEKRVKNDELLWLIHELLYTFENGLSIGSYLSQYLCNLYLSELYHDITENMYRIRKSKRGDKRVNLVYKCAFYMDDILLLGTNAKDLNKAVKLIKEKARQLGFTLKPSWRTFKIEKSFIDIMGYRIYKDHITIRRRVFKKIRRSIIKFKRSSSIAWARKIVSYNGQIVHSDSCTFAKKYKWNKALKKARKVISNESKISGATATCCC